MSVSVLLDSRNGTSNGRSARVVDRAAGVALQRLATEPDHLLAALREISGDAGGDLGQASVTRVIDEVSRATNLERHHVQARLAEQLRQVVQFAQLDGGTLDGSIESVAQLISSGRVELFAGR